MLSVIALTSAFPQDRNSEETPLARVGNTIITRKEFVERYESTPGFQRQIASKAQINKEVFLFSLISEKLLGIEAKAQGLDADTAYQNAVKEVEDPLVRDQLYHVEVRQKVVDTPAEIADAVAKSRITLNVLMLYASTKAGADFLESRIKSGMKLEDFSFVGDTTGEFTGPDSMTVHWGDNNEEIEKAAYSLKPGQTSEPIRFEDGWYIVKIMGETVTTGGGPEELANERRRAEEILSRRKEAVRMVEYLSTALKDKKAKANGKLFADLAGSMYDVCRVDSVNENRREREKFILSGYVMDSLTTRLAGEWDETFVDFPETKWTLGETVGRVFGQGFGVAEPTLEKIESTLDQALRNLIYQEELTQIGYKHDLEMSPRVQDKLSMWKDFYLANALKKKIADTVTVTDKDVADYRAEMAKDSVSLELVKLREIITQDQGAAVEVSRLLEQGTSFEKVAESFAGGLGYGTRTRTGYRTLSGLGGLGNLLRGVSVGGWAGPVHTREGYVFAQLLGKQSVSPLSADPNVDMNLPLRDRLIADRLKLVTDKYVAGLAGKFGVDIYADQLANTKVTSLPMLMFQLLGFGGRMFAVPLASPDVGWTQYWDSRGHLIP